MRRYSQVIRLRPEVREEYLRIHESVWPTVLATIEACNIRNYSLYLYEDLVVAYFEYHGEDYEADMRRMAEDPETQRWWTITDPMLVEVEGASPGRRWLELPEVFHFDGAPVSPKD
ncbi:MAG TPA: L-rhamnose mutarotase [Edaphobacter sp.]